MFRFVCRRLVGSLYCVLRESIHNSVFSVFYGPAVRCRCGENAVYAKTC